jgi:hypothetical protein
MALTNSTILAGEIASPVHPLANGCQFSLRCGSDLFFIKSFGFENQQQCQQLKRGDYICVVASPHSYVSKRCNSHHVFFEAVAVVVSEQTHSLQRLLIALGMEIFKQGAPDGQRESH